MYKNDNPKNVNFYEADFDLFKHLLNESIKAKGIEVIYLPRQYQNVDLILGEDVISKFSESFNIHMYLSSFSDYEGEGSMFAQFGLQVNDQITFDIDMDEFNLKSDNYHPLENDLLYVPIGKWVLEIFNVSKKDPFYHLGERSKYVLQARKFEFSHEQMETSIDELDQLNTLDTTDIESENDAIEDDINDILNISNPNYFGDK